ncbi:preprotein translocase subunit YajC [Bifidobacterium choloepi]|uniref:Preprotein translocase subunit YajC n=1 Tax=Bifidobacterium choloepi TaxID=2614131 RepID=A0A6I5N0D1_9BIFI|nr:preprotein translocase subunit YajC [Bifidobacterium choloepi]NEG69109.1 preprotein translocase subunit YajC [Bifidobacterium choloepi]
MDYIFLIILLVFMIGMLFFQSRKAKQQNQQVQDFRNSLQPGTEVITIGGVIGKVVSVDQKYEEIVIDSEGSYLRFAFKAINKEYIRPAYVDDSEVDENGNPLPTEPEQIEGDVVDTTVAGTDQAADAQQPADATEDTETVETEAATVEDGEEQAELTYAEEDEKTDSAK